MRRMSDVFELPVSADSDGDIPVNSGGWLITSTDVREPAAQHAAHAINHVDALADALELLLSDKAMIHFGSDKHLQARAALAAYRGEA